MRNDARRWGWAKNKCHARPTANKFSRLWNICNGIFSFHFFDEDPKTLHFDEKLLLEILLQMLAEQHTRCFPITENDVVKCKSKSIWQDLYCSCPQPWFSKDATVENKQMAECGSCRKWFHQMRKRISREIFEDKIFE